MNEQEAVPGVRLMSALVVRAPFDASILPAYEAKGGVVDIDWAPTTVLMDNIEKGARGDAIIVTVPAMDELVLRGIVDAASRVELVDSRIGVAVRAGAEHHDISTVEALVQTLLNARSVAYSLGGASGIYFQKLISQLGIADQINAKASTIPQGFTARQITEGNADVAIQQISELLVVEGVEVIGPLPEAVQSTTSFSAAAFVGCENADAVAELFDHLRSDASAIAYREKGLELR
ncbi:molybdate ABC transporter substrate-binding protein [Pseudomonas sp.]|uniref:molybdate ABC transporter substrate-binding protein n=1 Tax=Pseudomonas sp. TaxID=306 RepID=UPI003F66B201